MAITKNAWSCHLSSFLGDLRFQGMNSALQSRYCLGWHLPFYQWDLTDFPPSWYRIQGHLNHGESYTKWDSWVVVFNWNHFEMRLLNLRISGYLKKCMVPLALPILECLRWQALQSRYCLGGTAPWKQVIQINNTNLMQTAGRFMLIFIQPPTR